MTHSDLSETPEFIRGIKCGLITELQRSFPLNLTDFNSIGELHWSSASTSISYPPDKSGGYSK